MYAGSRGAFAAAAVVLLASFFVTSLRNPRRPAGSYEANNLLTLTLRRPMGLGADIVVHSATQYGRPP